MRDRMQELWDGAVPVGVPCPQADPAAVKRRVNAALNAVPSERRAYMRQHLRFAAAAAAIAALLAGSALAEPAGGTCWTSTLRGTIPRLRTT